MNDLSRSNLPLDELTRTGVAIREALTDQMVERLATTGATGLELLDRLNDETTNAAVHSLIDRLTEVHRAGALDTAFDLIVAAHAVRNALTDQMVERLVGFVEHMVTNVANEDVGDLVTHARSAMAESAQEAANMPTGGLMATISLLQKPETQRSLKFLLAFAGKMQDHATGK
ncbi:MAG: hypothetical protein KGQ46_08460 [Hyphomicrobiales bacterium]|nr:hypothetical protein [Hyphomicrobiales bacterium]MDE2114784.1 DUF1641 domain-containing protein [Hyphomicrobiales bacterium]